MPLINPELSKFKGKGAVIGCGHSPSGCNKELHASPNDFYFFDNDPDVKPDRQLDITEDLPAEFSGHFTLTLVERLPFFAYNKTKDTKLGEKGFQNLLAMTADDGFILIVGCPAQQEFREQIYSKELKYIELNNQTVLIPKNQQSSIHELEKQIKQLPSGLKETIHNITKNKNISSYKFCNKKYEDLSKFPPPNGNEELSIPTTDHKQKEVENFKRIYNALYAGQTSWLKRKNLFLVDDPELNIEDIKTYAKIHPKSRTATAWKIAEAHQDISSENTDLFKSIHQKALEKSSTFGLFKRTNIRSNEASKAKIEEAPADSRTGRIRDALNQR